LTVVQKLTESRFGISKLGIPIEIRSLMSAGIGCNFRTFVTETTSDESNLLRLG
jgi:hypothetical protein